MTETLHTAGPAQEATPPYSDSSLREFVDRVAPGWEIAHKPQGPSDFGQRIDTARESLDQLYSVLDARPTPTYAPGEPLDPLLELRENPRLLRSVLTEIHSIRKKLARLPRVIRKREGDEPRVVTMGDAYLQATGSVWDHEAVQTFINATQQHDAMELQELWAVPTVLKFLLLEEIIAQSAGVIKDPDSHTPAAAVLLKTRMKSVREVGYADWLTMIEPMVVYERILRQDPAEAYPAMDFESREGYRKRVSEIARYSDRSESGVAQAAVDLARERLNEARMEDSRVRMRQTHVGYYLNDRGFPQLALRVGYRPRLIDRIRLAIWRNADDFYIGGIQITTVILIGLILVPLVPTYPIIGGLTWAFLLLLLPVTQGAVDLVNNTITAIFSARALPKLDFSKGVPEELTTLVVVPALLVNEKQVHELFSNLEVRYLANQDPHIHFGLLTDLPDSITRPRQNDTDPLVELAIRLTNELNARYRSAASGSFFLLHRHRIFNARQGVWMGWERKRGKLLDLNRLLKDQFDPFPVKVGNLDVLRRAQYVITLDSDTQLPRGTAHSLIGALVHPLNRAIINPKLGVVTEGYGILQPRVGVSVHSASRSRLAAIYSGQTGFDVYTRAISDVYQDLYGEGIFTGKGIYEIDVLHKILDRRFPHNELLSHDLIEGSYCRVGLATDIEVIDDYPSHYSAYNRRKHRWMRGDWQIAQWLFAKVPDDSGKYGPNPITTISRWKIFDNLRRSLVDTFTFTLLIAGWLGLPGGALYWTLVTLFLMFVPTFVQFCFTLGRALIAGGQGSVQNAISGFWQGAFIDLFNLVFLPLQTLLALDAIIRSLVRRLITGQRLLEWETAAESESKDRRTTPVDRYLLATPLVALLVAALAAFDRHGSLLVALPILLLWGFAGAITTWLNKPPRDTHPHLSEKEVLFLRQLALRTWRFFYQFGNERHNFFIPDNVEEEGLFEAARVSPTNFGLLLNARQAASTFGYLTLPEFTALTASSLASYEKLAKIHGHIYNWYDTQTCTPIGVGAELFISSVDSGNLAASFYTLRSGCLSMVRGPLLDRSLFDGIGDHWRILESWPALAAHLKPLTPPAEEAAMDQWISWALKTADSPVFSEDRGSNDRGAGDASAKGDGGKGSPGGVSSYRGSTGSGGPATEKNVEKDEQSWWLAETRLRIRAIAAFVTETMPWLLPEFAPLRNLPQMQGLSSTADTVSVSDANAFATDLDSRIARASASLAPDSPEVLLAEKLRTALPAARERIQALTRSLETLASEAMRYATEMDFGFLIDRSRLMLSIGFEVQRNRLHQACYDMLSSEARIAAFITIAKGEVPQLSWFKLSRTHTIQYGQAVLISWTGTMFEYLMPSLWMHSYPDTLVSRTLSGVVKIQRAFAQELGIPWGISESGAANKDKKGHYHYEAYGIPSIALKWDAVAGPVISPYSTCLALGIEPVEALRNLRHMAKLGWMGPFGFYEAADYQPRLKTTRSRTSHAKTPQLVREWMAHHQGMSLLAILNLLHDNVVQSWFHANAHLKATELLLHEKPLPESVIKAEYRASQPAKGMRKAG